MTDFVVSLAGLKIGVSALYPSTKDFLKDYIVTQNDGAAEVASGADDAKSDADVAKSDAAEVASGADVAKSDAAVDFSVSVSEEDIEFERMKSAEQDEADGIPVRHFSDCYLETLAVLRHIADRLPEFNAILFHGSVIAYKGRAYMFTAPSGTGKTTHVRMWLEQLPEAYVLNGDKPFLKADAEGKILACGNPWQGKENYGCNEMLPLEAICLLERAPDNHISEIDLNSALPALMRQTHHPANGIVDSLRVLGQVSSNVRLYRLGCNTDPEAAQVSSRAMLVSEDIPDGHAADQTVRCAATAEEVRV